MKTIIAAVLCLATLVSIAPEAHASLFPQSVVHKALKRGTPERKPVAKARKAKVHEFIPGCRSGLTTVQHIGR